MPLLCNENRINKFNDCLFTGRGHGVNTGQLWANVLIGRGAFISPPPAARNLHMQHFFTQRVMQHIE